MQKNDFLKLKPMLLKETKKPFNDKDYIYEIKFDGIRCLIFINNKEIIIQSRNNIILNELFPELLNIKNINTKTCILDGEIILFDQEKPNFSKLQERLHLKNKHRILYYQKNSPVSFVCFDILYLNKDLTKLPLIKRKKILNNFTESEVFIKSIYFEDGVSLFKMVQKNNLEGIVAKKKNSFYYYNYRSDDWLKIKNIQKDYFYICGYNKNKNENKICIILGEKINDNFYYVGKVLMGQKQKLFLTILNEKIYLKNYLINCNLKCANYIKPKYKIEIGFLQRTKNNHLRQPFIK